MFSRQSGRLPVRIAVVLTAAALALTACGSDSSDSKASGGSDAGDLSSVTITLGQNDPALKALLPASGALDGAPYKVDFVDFSNQVEASTALATGKIDGSVLAQYTVIQAAANAKPAWTEDTAPYRTVLVPQFVDVENHDPFGTVASAKSGITELTADSVRGKKWTASPGATNYLTMLQTLDHLGLGLNDIDYVQLDNAAGALALLNNEVDLASGLFSSYFATLDNGGTALDSSHQVGPGSPTALVASTASLSNPLQAKAWEDFVQRYVEFRKWILENKDQYVDVLVATTKVKPEQAAFQWLQFGRGSVSPVTDADIAKGQDIADLAYKAGVLPAKIDASIGYDARFTDVIDAKIAAIGVPDAVARSIAANPKK
ncbi:ABC transporter substrate-binding protein [Rhodococcus globerulus]|uniref:ABC transporter substrate-binding protein n=1 Tax=Rhodococcus globerulus TaxID=33008 RepID=A0ABU4C4K9_RHOGO|nr:hypothetical protein [Rhodococcus globerulus]MDV6271437.1 hypothetical protein [Rhodococcus globerulus]